MGLRLFYQAWLVSCHECDLTPAALQVTAAKAGYTLQNNKIDLSRTIYSRSKESSTREVFFLTEGCGMCTFQSERSESKGELI